MSQINVNRLHEIPKSWVWVALERITAPEKGSIRMGPFGSQLKKNELVNDGIRVLWIENIVDNKFEYKKGKFITQEKYEKLKGFKVNPKELLITMMGTIGRVAIVPDNIGKAIISSHLSRVRIETEVCLPEYLKYVFQSDFLKKQLDIESRGVVMKGLNTKIIRSLNIPLPPINEQCRIVGRVELLFSFLDAGVAQLRLVQGQLKRYRQAVLKAAFEGKLTQQWRSVNNGLIESTNQLLEKNKQNRIEKIEKKYDDLPSISTKELHELPTSWVWIRLGEIVRKIQYGTSEKASIEETGIPVLRMGNLKDGKIVFDKLKYFPKNWQQLSEFLLNEGDVLFNRTNSAELVGKTAVYKEIYPKTVFASYLIRVQTDKTIYLPELLSYFINSVFGRKYVASVVSQQVGQANVNGTKLALMPIPFMSIQEQVLIRQEIERCFSLADVTEVEVNQSLKQTDFLRQSILKNAFEGKLVFQDPSDEPAEKLLERIKVKRLSNISKNNNRVELSEYVK